MWDEFDNITVIGDVHGKTGRYKELVNKASGNPTIQVGDFGFKEDYDWFAAPKVGLDQYRNRILFGNHDYYPYLNKPYSFSGHSSSFVWRGTRIMLIRGAYSIDQQWRILGKDWFVEEEIPYHAWDSVINAVDDFKPHVMISHDVCYDANVRFLDCADNKSKTAMGLQACFDVHKPDIWIHGHHHHQYDKDWKGTRFVGLKELGTFVLKG